MAEESKASSISLHAHGDGTYHTHTPARSCDGSCTAAGARAAPWEGGPTRKDHQSIGHALMHIAKKHAEGDHMHIHGHDDGFTTHHVMEGSPVQGPHDPGTMRELKRHVAETMDSDDGD